MFPSFMFLKREVLCLRYSVIIISFQDTECYELKDELYELYSVFFLSGFGGLGVACWSLVPKFAGSNPAETVGFLGRKNP